MGVLSDNAIIGASGAVSGYDIDDSLRYSSGDSPALYKDVGADPDDGLIMTISFWTKRGKLGSYVRIGGCKKAGTTTNLEFGFMDSNIFEFYFWDDTDTAYGVNTVAVFRDCSAWYHFTIIFNAADSTAADRIKIYVNGVRQDVVSRNSGYPPTNKVTGYTTRDFIRGAGTSISNPATPSFQYPFDGYLADFACIDGTVYAASDFGELNSVTNQWIPKDISDLTFGQNGFYLKFEDSANLGNDSSGNNYDWTVVNLVATDQMIDTPQNSTGGNWCTLDPTFAVAQQQCGSITYTEGNLGYEGTSGGSGFGTNYPAAYGTIAQTSGKWYAEFLCQTASGESTVEGGPGVSGLDGFPTSGWNGIGLQGSNCFFVRRGELRGMGQDTGGYVTFGDGDIISVAMDLDNLKAYWAKNNTWITIGGSVGVPTSGATGTGALSMDAISTSGPYTFEVGNDNTTDGKWMANFGQDSSFAGNETAQGNQDGNSKGDFYYAVPSGYLALCTDNLPTPSISGVQAGENFNTVLYTGTGSELAVTGAGFQPDFTWIKTRALAYNNRVFDVVRGVTKELYTNTTGADVIDTESLKSFDSDGFTLGTSDGVNPVSTMVSWNWKAGGTAASNTDGSITSSVSANPTAGFSIVGWTGTGSDATVGHGLSQAPDLIINKSRDLSSASSQWAVQSILWNSPSDTNILYLNQLSAVADDTNIFQAAPTASVFSPQGGAWAGIGATEDYIAYCFHSIEGYSKVGIYTSSNNHDGPFVFTGFKPAWIMLKSSTGGNYDVWSISDNKRNTYNVVDNHLTADGACQENYSSRTDGSCTSRNINIADFLSNGFKLRESGGENNGGVGTTYIYIAIAESPFKTSNAR